jgi:hypothetical protein
MSKITRYKDFGSCKISGEGKYPKTFLPRGQPARVRSSEVFAYSGVRAFHRLRLRRCAHRLGHREVLAQHLEVPAQGLGGGENERIAGAKRARKLFRGFGFQQVEAGPAQPQNGNAIGRKPARDRSGDEAAGAQNDDAFRFARFRLAVPQHLKGESRTPAFPWCGKSESRRGRW